MKPYLYFEGLKKLVKDIKGDEIVHLGIRPYGFHAGNAMALIVYPYLLCKYLNMEGKKLKLKFVFSINDWEQDCLDGPDPGKYLFNIYPKNSSLQFMPDKEGCHKSITKHWQPIIEKNVKSLKKIYPSISVRFVKNSDLKKYSFFTHLLLETIKNPESQAKIFKKYSGKEVLNDPVQYAGVICENCHRSRGKTIIVGKDVIKWECNECHFTLKDNFKNFDYWWYHKPLLLARMKIFKIDITISGGDHFSEGDFEIRKAFIKKYAPDIKEPKMLFTPTVLTLDGQKMSKSRNNTAYANIKELILATDGYMRSEIQVNDKLILKNINEKDYCCVL
ncbi:MAG: hypothetical protein V1732_06295 [Patescibacteria group bacterium]